MCPRFFLDVLFVRHLRRRVFGLVQRKRPPANAKYRPCLVAVKLVLGHVEGGIDKPALCTRVYTEWQRVVARVVARVHSARVTGGRREPSGAGGGFRDEDNRMMDS